MNQIIPSVCALALVACCTFPKQAAACPLFCSPPVRTCCYDAYREPYRIAYPRLGCAPEQVEITKTQRALEMRRAAVLRQREGVRFERGILAASAPITQPASSGVTIYGETEGAGVVESACPVIPPAPPYPGPGVRRLARPVVVGERIEKITTVRVPIATPVPGKPGCVYSPFTTNGGYVDVKGLAPGSLAKDPYTGRHFRVP